MTVGRITVSPDVTSSPDVFLAGGISGVGDWQSYAVNALASRGISVANPRRPGMMSDPSLEPDQVRWEIDHLKRSRAILFWFPGPGDHPVAMYELGRWAITDKPLIVGCPPQYKRRVNIVTQLADVRPELAVNSTLNDTLFDAIQILEPRTLST